MTSTTFSVPWDLKSDITSKWRCGHSGLEVMSDMLVFGTWNRTPRKLGAIGSLRGICQEGKSG